MFLVKNDGCKRMVEWIGAADPLCGGGQRGKSLFADFGTRFVDAPENEVTNDVHLGGVRLGPWQRMPIACGGRCNRTVQEGVTTARIIPFRRQMVIRFRADAFPGAHELTLTLRYKDDVHAPATIAVRINEEGDDWLSVGGLGGAYDHMWKTVQFAIPRLVVRERGVPRIQNW